MVRFAPHVSAALLVRERVPPAEERPPASAENGGASTAAESQPTATGGPAAATVDDAIPDPFDDADALEELEEEITVLAAHIHAATHRFLMLVAQFDRRRGWELGGHRSCAYWLAFRTGLDLPTAREKVRTARALAGLPKVGEAMSQGRLSFSQVRALTRVATKANEEDLLQLAEGCTTAHLERMVRAFRRGSRMDEAELERQRYESRTFSVVPDEEGMYVVRGKVTAEVGAVLMRAVEAASDALYRKQKEIPGLETDTQKKAAQRRADAVGLLSERALAAGFGTWGPRGSGEPDGEAGADPNEHIPISGTRAERYQVVLHVDAETLRSEAEPDLPEAPTGAGERGSASGPRSELEDGTRVSAETARRLACDASVVVMTHAPDGSILDVGRKRRTISPAIRRALDSRDRGCRFPGCGLRFTQGHHLHHWADGGPTSLANSLLLCRHHHTLVHEGGWKIAWWGEGNPAFFDPRGHVHFDGRWEAPELGEEAVQELLAENHGRGVDPGRWTAGAEWKREADIPAPVWFRALEGFLS